MDTLCSDLGDHPAASFFYQDRVESVGSTDEKWIGSHRLSHAACNVFTAPRGAAEAGIGAGHAIQRKSEHNNSTAVNRKLELRGTHVSPESNVIENRLL